MDSGTRYQSLFRDPSAAAGLAEADWEPFLEWAEDHGVGPLLYHLLHKQALPPQVAAALRQSYLNGVALSLRSQHHVVRLLGALQTARIPVMALKGVCLARAVYRDPALRPMVDVDLLVRRPDLAAAVEALSAAGYSAPHEFTIDAECRVNHHLPPLEEPGGMMVDIHWTIMASGRSGQFGEAELEDVWRRAQPLIVAGIPVLMPAPEDLLLHLCMHFAVQHNCNGGLRNLADLAQVMERYETGLNWPQIGRRAGQWGIEPAVYLTLRLAERWFGMAAPPDLMLALRPGSAADAEAALALADDKLIRGVAPAVPSQIGEFAAQPGLMSKLRVLRRSLLPSPQELSQIYPVAPDSPRVVVYYCRRWWEAISRHGRTMWQVMRGDAELLRWARSDDALRRWLAGDNLG